MKNTIRFGSKAERGAILLLALFLFCMNIPIVHADSTVTDNWLPFALLWDESSNTAVTYTTSNENHPNPERGFYKHTETHSDSYTPLSTNTLQNYYDDGNTLILRVFYLEEFLDSDISQSYLDNMQADFDTLRNAGLKAVVRFAYTKEYLTSPPFGDATKARVLGHIAQLTSILASNADVIATIQAGFIGTWGEWHFTDHFVENPDDLGNVTVSDYADRREVVDALLDALPPTIQVQIRTPEDKQHMYGDGSSGAGAALTEELAHDGSNLSRAAHHNDCFLASDSDFGTYGNVTEDKAYLALETRYLVMGGETCNPNPPRSSCATALEELARFHWTYLNADYHPDVLDSWVTDGCMAEVQQRLGYRLALQHGLYSDAVRPGNGFTFQLALQNLGFAAPIKARPVKLLLRHTSSGDLYHVSLPVDTREWLPTGDVSGDHVIEQTICTPATMPIGDYALLLHLPDASENLAAQPNYAIRLANDNLWEGETGYNNLLHTIRVDSSTASVGCENALQLQTVNGMNTDLIYLSSSTGGRVDGVRFFDEDILSVDLNSGNVQKVFDGSDVGVRADLNAFHILADGSILMSFNRPVTVNGFRADDSDIVRFIPTKLGEDTAGSFELYFDGSGVGLTSRGEDIDAIAIASDGRLIISTLGNFRGNPSTAGGTLNGRDEDLFLFNQTSLGATTAGTWELYFDGSDVGLSARAEDAWGAAVDPTQDALLLTVRGAFAINGGLTGNGADIFSCPANQLGVTTSCLFSMLWDGSTQGFGREQIDGFSLSNGATLSIAAASRSEGVEAEDSEELLDDDVPEDVYLPIIAK